MFIHKGKKGQGQEQESQEIAEKVETEGVENFCSCDPKCKESYDALSGDLDLCKGQLEQLKDRLVRATADFQNYQRRVEKEKAQWIFVAQSELLHGILPVLDDFDRAFAEHEGADLPEQVRIFLDGFLMTKKALCKFLELSGVTQMQESKIFDPNLHEAISQIDMPDYESGQIVQVAQKGYMFKDQVLRVAKVVVAK